MRTRSWTFERDKKSRASQAVQVRVPGVAFAVWLILMTVSALLAIWLQARGVKSNLGTVGALSILAGRKTQEDGSRKNLIADIYSTGLPGKKAPERHCVG